MWIIQSTDNVYVRLNSYKKEYKKMIEWIIKYLSNPFMINKKKENINKLDIDNMDIKPETIDNPKTNDSNEPNVNLNNGHKTTSHLVTSTKTAKPKNQDYCKKYEGKYISAVAIADGLGSSIDAHEASKIVVENFLKNIKESDIKGTESIKLDAEDIIEFWQKNAIKLNEFYKLHEEKYENEQNVLQTTLITVVELDDRYLISYTGNGSILYIRGDFWSFWNKRWPWCISDLMTGHSIIGENGREVLYGYLGPNREDSSDLKILNINKDKRFGDILVLTTDGICSSDQNKVGREDSTNKLWAEINPHIEKLINEYFVDYFKKVIDGENEGEEILEKTIEKFLDEETFEDDATVGIIMSKKAIEYYLHSNKK